MKLSTKLSLAMGALVLLLVILGVFSLVQMDNINQSSTVIAQEWLPKVTMAEEMNTISSDFRVQQLQHVVAQSPEEMAGPEKRLSELRASFEDLGARLQPTLVSDEGKRIFADIMQRWTTYVKEAEQIRALSRENRTQEAMARLNGQAKADYDEMCAALLDLVKLNTSMADQASRDGDAAYEQSRNLVLALIVVAIILAAVVAVLIIRNTLRQLGKDPAALAGQAQVLSGLIEDMKNA